MQAQNAFSQRSENSRFLYLPIHLAGRTETWNLGWQHYSKPMMILGKKIHPEGPL